MVAPANTYPDFNFDPENKFENAGNRWKKKKKGMVVDDIQDAIEFRVY